MADYGTVYVGAKKNGVGSYGLWKSVDFGNHFTKILNEIQVSEIFVNPVESQIILIGTLNGIYKSIDGGNSWVNKLLLANEVYEIRRDSKGNCYAATEQGFYKSIDDGENWVLQGDTYRYRGLAIASDDTLYCGRNYDGIGVWKSTDKGANWTQIKALANPLWNIAVDWWYPNILYYSSYTDGLYKSIDGGYNWQMIHYWESYGGAIEIRPDNDNVLLDGVSGVPPSVLYSRISKDQGNTWLTVTVLPYGRIMQFAFEALNNSIVYATGIGLYKSLNGGDDWTLLSSLNTVLSSVGLAKIHLECCIIVYQKPTRQMSFNQFQKNVIRVN